MNEAPIYPMSLYLFDANGRYDANSVITIENDGQLNGPGTQLIIKNHIKSGLEVRVTDPGDNCLFHAMNGKVIFPR